MNGITPKTPTSIPYWDPLFNSDRPLWSQETELLVSTFSLLSVSVFLSYQRDTEKRSLSVWDEENQKGLKRFEQCRYSFSSVPVIYIVITRCLISLWWDLKITGHVILNVFSIITDQSVTVQVLSTLVVDMFNGREFLHQWFRPSLMWNKSINTGHTSTHSPSQHTS